MLSSISYKRCNAEFYYIGEIPRVGIGRPLLQRGVVLKWFYSPRAVGATLSEVHALYRVPRRNNQKSHDVPEKSRFADEVGERYDKIEKSFTTMAWFR